MRIFLLLLLTTGQMFGQARTLLDPTLTAPAAGTIVAVLPNPGISAEFSMTPSGGSWPLGVQFADLTQGGPTSWSWTFGDGGTSTLQNPAHTFLAPAQTYTISLTATGPGGSSSKSHTLTVTNAIPMDIPLFVGVAPGGGSKHIRSNGRWSVFIAQIPGAPNNDAYAYCYTDGGQTNALTMPNLLASIGLTIDHAVKSNTLVVVGPSPSGGQGSVFEYELGNQSPLPTTISLTTNFTVGASGFTDANATLLSNGGIACAVDLSNGTFTNYALAVSYRRPNGVWTNLGVVNVDNNDNIGSSAFPSTMASAEMPGTNQWWTFQNRDSSGWILAGVWNFTTTDLTLSMGFRLVDNHLVNSTNFWGYQAPYGEFPRFEAQKDSSTNRILLNYFSDKGYSGAPSVRVGTQVLTAVTADTNHYLFCLSTNTSHRQLPGTICYSNAVITFGYANCTSANVEPLDGQAIPWNIQEIPNGSISGAPSSPFFDYKAGTAVAGVQYRADAEDFVVFPIANGVWHLMRLTQ